MAAGEYVSVSSQADSEATDIRREKQALRHQLDIKLKELILIYESRGLAPDTARLVACEPTEYDAIDAHMRDELDLTKELAANPLQAALASGLTFTLAGGILYVAALLTLAETVVPVVLVVTLAALALLGWLEAMAGGARVRPAICRVLFWDVFAMAVASGIGHPSGAVA